MRYEDLVRIAQDWDSMVDRHANLLDEEDVHVIFTLDVLQIAIRRISRRFTITTTWIGRDL